MTINKLDVNVYLTDILGECYHNWKYSHGDAPFRRYKCDICNMGPLVNPGDNINLFTWIGFGILWEWAIKQKWWKEFNGSIYFAAATKVDDVDVDSVIYWEYINPEKFAIAIYEFLLKTKE